MAVSPFSEVAPFVADAKPTRHLLIGPFAPITCRAAKQCRALRPVVRLFPQTQDIHSLLAELGVLLRRRSDGSQLEAVPGRIEKVDRVQEIVMISRAYNRDTSCNQRFPG